MTAEQRAKMVALLEECKKEEQHYVICFLANESNKPIKNHPHLKLQYDNV